MNNLFEEKFNNFIQFLETKLTEANLESDKLQKLKLLNQTNLFKPLFKINIPFIQELLQTHNLNLLVKFDFTENEIKYIVKLYFPAMAFIKLVFPFPGGP